MKLLRYSTALSRAYREMERLCAAGDVESRNANPRVQLESLNSAGATRAYVPYYTTWPAGKAASCSKKLCTKYRDEVPASCPKARSWRSPEM